MAEQGDRQLVCTLLRLSGQGDLARDRGVGCEGVRRAIEGPRFLPPDCVEGSCGPERRMESALMT